MTLDLPALSWLIQGIVGWGFLYGFFIFDFRRKTEAKMIQEKYDALNRKYKHTFGRCRILEDEVGFLHEAMKRAEAREKEDQQAQEELNGKLAQRDKLLRSRDFELDRERSKQRGRW